jgi:glycosyltransferase involved in cell wall biosynthesis
LYFAQDFEPAFFPWSSASVLAENTYKFGFHGLTIGKWLSQKLTHEYGMTSDYYDYAVDKKNYSVTNVGNRNEIVFYARPPTPRRATEFGLLVLSELHRQRPDIIINLVGWDMDGYKVPFPFVNHKAVKITQLNGIYNRCSAGLVLSLTNMSLLPLELLSAGVVPVVNDADNTKEVINSPNISYVPLSPLKIVKEIIDIIDSPDHGLRAQKLSLDVQNNDWSGPAAQFVEKFEKAMITSLKPNHSQWQK